MFTGFLNDAFRDGSLEGLMLLLMLLLGLPTLKREGGDGAGSSCRRLAWRCPDAGSVLQGCPLESMVELI